MFYLRHLGTRAAFSRGEMKKNTKKRQVLGRVILYGLVGLSVAHTYHRHFMNRPRAIVLSETPMMLPHPKTKLSAHDDHIERVSLEQNIDWRLTAAVISVESSFNEKARSKVGAVGLMQVMPVVFREQKSPVAYAPEENIRIGLTHLRRLYDRIQAQSEYDRLKMSFAAYNAGIGHLRDAQRLARQRGLNPRAWADVAKVFPLLESAQFHQRSTYGYCQGRGIVQYVRKVTQRYEDLQMIYPIQRLNPTVVLASSEQPSRS